MFNDPIAVETFKRLVKEFGINTLIETGTDQGHGAYDASQFVPFVHTIENDSERRNRAMDFWKGQKAHGFITSWLASSPDALNIILGTTQVPLICFYLDAHGDEYWPLLDELIVIAERKVGNCVIIIHDFKVPGKPWGYDSYGGKDLDIDYVREALAAINPNFKIFYNEEAEGNKRGIMYATP